MSKLKKCKVCREWFTPDPIEAKVCSEFCAMTYAASARGKAEKVKAIKARKADKVQRDKLKRRGDWLAEAQAAFNLFIRTRDRQAGYLCISSGRQLDWSGNNVDAGHYRSRGSAPHLRFDERNCHAQTKQENRYASGNVVGYRCGLIERIGQEAVDALEADQEPRKYTIDDLKAIKREYMDKTKQLEANA